MHSLRFTVALNFCLIHTTWECGAQCGESQIDRLRSVLFPKPSVFHGFIDWSGSARHRTIVPFASLASLLHQRSLSRSFSFAECSSPRSTFANTTCYILRSHRSESSQFQVELGRFFRSLSFFWHTRGRRLGFYESSM